MNKLVVFATCVIAIFALYFIPIATYASNANLSTFSIVVNPTYPVPYSTMKLTIKSYSFNISSATFTATVNGVRIAQSTGATPISIKTTGAGTVMNIRVSVAVDGKIYEKTLNVHPAGVSVVVEPLTTAPFLYSGTPTIPTSGKIRIVAVPNFSRSNGTPIPPKKLSYTWHIGNQTLSTSSGIGHSVVIVSAPPPYRQTKISVTVRAQDYPETASRTVTLVSRTPIVRIYKDDPLMGILYDHALFGKQTIISSEISFVAQTYGFSASNGLPSFVWYLNGTKSQTGNLVTLRPQGVGKGTATLSVSANKEANYESASDAIALQFGKAARSGLGIFGL